MRCWVALTEVEVAAALEEALELRELESVE
jgi:hypothetical protein